MLGHAMGEWVITLEPTCIEVGTKRRDCTRTDCDHYELAIVDKLGHNFSDEFTVDVEATCYSVGSKSKHCSRCEAVTEVTEIPMTNHVMGEWTNVLAPNCNENGTDERVCTNDGCTYKETRVADKLGHAMGEWVITLEPTCIEVGTKRRDCTRDNCDHYELAIVDKLGHNFSGEFTVDVEATCTESGKESRHCSCRNPLGHLCDCKDRNLF
jgi:hypothetical protein